ncbi:MAG: hypothetical protein A2820_01210 [Candidatus Buchananbacteria bacterium RIFCSPHIGHO2_01_FULL_40_35]|nr:MAG: hypothetical protein A2820_01210 [Candidatus Buchananbacteria bacterium RIFCSPHIGHO2_01_FULL_40_35]
MENKTNPWTIVLAVLITAVVVGGGVYYWQTQNSTKVLPVEKVTSQPTTSDTQEAVTQPVVKSNKPIITYPANGSTVNGVTIKGTAKPNSEIWAYVNYPKNEMACITSNSYASGGASTVDAKGNFEFALAEPCSKELTVVVSTEDPTADKTGSCRSSENVSQPITFTNSGELPGICNQ